MSQEQLPGNLIISPTRPTLCKTALFFEAYEQFMTCSWSVSGLCSSAQLYDAFVSVGMRRRGRKDSWFNLTLAAQCLGVQ